MPTDPIVLVGAGGHGRVVLDAARTRWPDRPLRVADDDRAKVGQLQLGILIESLANLVAKLTAAEFHVAIGDNDTRVAVARRLADAGWRPASILHPASVVSAFAQIKSGAFIASGATVAAGATIGEHAIVNHHAIVDHDATVGAGTHVAPGAILSGGSRLGQAVLLGAGAVVLPRKAVGDRAVVGAGAVVVTDIPSDSMALGVPARSRTQS